MVHDAASFGGRNAMWELIMCLLHGEEEKGAQYDGSEDEEGTDDDDKDNNNNNVAVAVQNNGIHNRGLQKNEALAIRYLTRLAGVEEVDSSSVDEDIPASASTLPTDEPQHSTFCHDSNADEAALIELATCHLSGIGLPQPNPTLAIHCLTKAFHCCQSVESAHKLALLYEYPNQSNNTIPIDVVAAFEWFKAAALKGHVTSMAELALCYELGCGVTQSDEEALDWYTKAAHAGHSASHYSVGEHFEEARGVRMDHEEACLWYYRAAVLGEEDGVCGLRRLVDVARRVVPQVDEVLHA